MLKIGKKKADWLGILGSILYPEQCRAEEGLASRIGWDWSTAVWALSGSHINHGTEVAQSTATLVSVDWESHALINNCSSVNKACV